MEWTYDAASCAEAENLATKQMGNIDIYNMYADVCVSESQLNGIRVLAEAGSVAHRIMHRQIKVHLASASSKKHAENPCIDDAATQYLNQASVLAAINAKP